MNALTNRLWDICNDSAAILLKIYAVGHFSKNVLESLLFVQNSLCLTLRISDYSFFQCLYVIQFFCYVLIYNTTAISIVQKFENIESLVLENKKGSEWKKK